MSMTTSTAAAPPAILALVSAPLVDLDGEPIDLLDVGRELDDLEEWLGEPGRSVELTVEWAETERLQRALLRRPFDLLHFAGHGHPQALAFEDGRGGLQALTQERLVDLVCPGGKPAFRQENEAALRSYERALALFQAVGDRLGEANTLAAQGMVYVLDQPEKADDLLKQAIAIYQRIGSRYSVPAQIGNFGWTLLRLGEKERARPYLLRAADLFDQIGLSDYADRLRKYAR